MIKTVLLFLSICTCMPAMGQSSNGITAGDIENSVQSVKSLMGSFKKKRSADSQETRESESKGPDADYNKPIPEKFLGNWRGNTDCELAAGTFTISTKNPIDVEVNSNQIYISANAVVSTENPNVILIYLNKPGELGRGGMNLKWNDYSKSEPIAELSYLSTKEMTFKWKGFYNTTTKQYEWQNDADWTSMDGFDGKLHKCN